MMMMMKYYYERVSVFLLIIGHVERMRRVRFRQS